jgi:hypothetical protein
MKGRAMNAKVHGKAQFETVMPVVLPTRYGKKSEVMANSKVFSQQKDCWISSVR